MLFGLDRPFLSWPKASTKRAPRAEPSGHRRAVVGLVVLVVRLPAAAHRVAGTHPTPGPWPLPQALLVLVRFGKGEDVTLLGARFGICQAACYRYLADGLTVQASDRTPRCRGSPPTAGRTYVTLNGKLRPSLFETTVSAKGRHGGRLTFGQAPPLRREHPNRHRSGRTARLGTSEAIPGHRHDTTCAREPGASGAPNRAGAQPDLHSPADSGYDRTWPGQQGTIKQSVDRNTSTR